MSKDNIVKLHSSLASGTYNKKYESPEVEKMLSEPHLAIFINGDWLPILPGMVIGLVRNRAHVDGIAPYKFRRVGLKPGKEFIDLVAWSTDQTNTRRLQFIANYSGVYRSGINDADQMVDASVAAKQMAAEKDEDK